MHLGHDDPLRVAAARTEFLECGADRAAGVRDVVAASWRRSQSAGVDADEYRTTYHDDIDLDSRLARCARPVIERLALEMCDVPVTIALSDAHARIVDRLDCSTSVGRLLDRVDFNAGFSFAEGGVGTNGIGTVFEAGAAVSVVGAEHFTEALVRFACTGAPILDPVSGRVEGVLDVSSLAETWTPLMLALVRRAAEDIGRNLLLDRGLAQQALFETFVKADARPRQAVIAVGDALMVNQRAQQLFTPAEQFAIHQHARFLMCHRDRVAQWLTLESGRRVRIRATRVTVGEEVAGVVLLLDDESDLAWPAGHTSSAAPEAGHLHRRPWTWEPAAAPGAPRRPRPAIADGRSPGWVSACSQITSALARGHHLLVMGEPGTGKSTLVADLFRHTHPSGRLVCRDVTRMMGDGLDPGRSAGGDGRASGDEPTLIVLRGLDRVGVDEIGQLSDVLDRLDRDRRLVAATLSDASLGNGLPFEGLLGHFEQAVTLPPIRFRTDDLPLILARILREIAPDRRIGLNPEASRLICRYAWPGNLTQLREALQGALRKRPVGELQPEDLPGYCRTVNMRTLTTIETAERDAIIKALQENGGNRMHAATALGMSRSSLYRKIKSYSIAEA